MAKRRDVHTAPNPRERTIMSDLKPQGGLGQMLAQQGADPKLLEAVAEVEGMPGGMELLYTVAAEDLMKGAGASKKDAKKIRLYKLGGPVRRAKGGSVRDAAETTRRAGRGDDSMMLHVSPEEYEVIEAMWGKAEINPETGIGEYGFLSKVWKKIKKTVKKIVKSDIFQIVAPIALSIFVPGLGTAIGSALGASGAAASVIGNALVQGGLSAAGGGDFLEGALSGAITGGLGEVAGGAIQKVAPGLSDSTAAIIGSSLAGGTASSLTGGEFMEGALAGGLGEMMRPSMESLTEVGQRTFGVQDPTGGGILAERVPQRSLTEIDLATIPPRMGGAEQAFVGPPAPGVDPYGPGGGRGNVPSAVLSETGVAAAPSVTPAPVPDVTPPAEGGTDLMQYALPAMMMLGSQSAYEEAVPPEMPPWMTESLPIYEMNRQFQGLDPNAYYTYGQAGASQSGQHLFMTPEPFAGEVGTPTVGPTGGLGLGDLAQLIASGQVVPAAMGETGGVQLQGAGYRQDPNTGDWLPPQQQLGQGLPRARGGYQRGGEFDYWSQNADVPRAAPSVAASGRYVKGAGTGRSDDIPARLSDGEYVMDAESVALLGDGSGDAGARRLDEMRSNLRKHKAKNLMKGGFSHKAKKPHQYMAGGGIASLRRAATEAGRA